MQADATRRGTHLMFSMYPPRSRPLLTRMPVLQPTKLLSETWT
jgi:hypothetical protein